MRSFSACAKFLWAFAVALVLSGCIPSTHPPERLFPIAYEMDLIRTSQGDLASQYSANFLSSPAQAKLIRNEIIAQRMYAIDVQYTLYENALTRETQEVGFGALTTAEGLSTAATLVTPAATKTILSAAATAVLAIKGHYDSQILLAQAMRNIQKQMRASRNMIAAGISAKLVQGVSDYPLSAALSDLEEYYAAGTLTSGVIDTSTTVGIRETETKNIKQDVTQAPPALRAAILRDATTPMAAPAQLPVIVQQGSGFREQRLLPSVIKQLQRVVCLEVDGKFSAQLRTRAIAHLNKIKQKDPSAPNDLLSTRDVNIMQDEDDKNVKDCS
ncbi:MAG: hypothetical protein QOI05_3441 [Bradyrhizobium sp.]|jgi:hypothetical protein|nr:hypothetical protein [Bradyrhizobium sp.]